MSDLCDYLRLLDFKTLEATDLSSVHFVHVYVSVLFQLVLSDAAVENNSN